MRRLVFTVLVLTNLFINFQNTYSQTVTPDLSLSSIPTDPEPLSTVNIVVTSFSLDLNKSEIDWTYNGKLISSGIGKKSINVKAPENGSSAVVSVTVSGGGFDSKTESMAIRPGGVDLLFEAVDSYTPPFYKGKALLSYGGKVRITAIPGVASSKTTTFDWSKDNTPMQSISGYGKSSITLKQNELKNSENIKVSTSGGLFNGNGSIDIIPLAPSLIAYANSEGFIDYANGWENDISIHHKGVILRFEPYYFSIPKSIDTDLDTNIFVDNNPIKVFGKTNELSLSTEDGGESNVKLEIFTKEYSLQNIKKIFSVIFD